MQGKIALEEHFAIPETLIESAGLWIPMAGIEKSVCWTSRTSGWPRSTATASR